jgi:hypothetical protein
MLLDDSGFDVTTRSFTIDLPVYFIALRGCQDSSVVLYTPHDHAITLDTTCLPLLNSE